MIIDATDLIIGRFATKAAKAALLGEEVHIINCEKAIITGHQKKTIAMYKQRRERGTPAKGPFFPKQAHMIVKRAIRGMLPYKKERGKLAFARIKCYIGVPAALADKKTVQIKDAHVKKIPVLKYIAVSKIAKHIGGRHE